MWDPDESGTVNGCRIRNWRGMEFQAKCCGNGTDLSSVSSPILLRIEANDNEMVVVSLRFPVVSNRELFKASFLSLYVEE